MWNKSETSSWTNNNSAGTWTTTDQALERTVDGSTVGSGSEGEGTGGRTLSSESLENEVVEQVLVPESPCNLIDGNWVCHPYKIEQLEQQLYSNSPGASRRTAIIETLRHSESFMNTHPCCSGSIVGCPLGRVGYSICIEFCELYIVLHFILSVFNTHIVSSYF
jgi:hypothetical protein